MTGKVFGVERVPVVKDQAMPAYDPRAIQGIGVTYATTPMGADHTAGYAIAAQHPEGGRIRDPSTPKGRSNFSGNLQIATAAVDSTGMCLFVAFAVLDQPETFQALIDLLNAFYGLNLTGDDVVARQIRPKDRTGFQFRPGRVYGSAGSPAVVLQERNLSSSQRYLPG